MLSELEMLKSLWGFYDGLALIPPSPLVLFASTLVPSPCPIESPCTPVDIDLGYSTNVPCLYYSFFLAPFVLGDIKYFRIGGRIDPGGGNI